jgi:hypothetical protein
VPGADASTDATARPPTPAASIAGAPSSTVTVRADARSAVIQAKLNAFLGIATPTYTLPDGTSVAVSAFFGMAGGFASPDFPRNRAIRDPLIQRLGLAPGFDWNRPAMADIQKLTQALIDAGNLPSSANVLDTWGVKPSLSSITLTPAARVRCMAFNFGIGIDCAGYAHQALLYAHGGTDGWYNLRSLGNENFMALGGNRAWQAVGVEGARPGDIVALSAASARSVGHVITVFDRQIATAQADRDALAAPILPLIYTSQTDQVMGYLAVTGSVSVFHFDASWGASAYPVADGAGVQRRQAMAIEGADGKGYMWICQGRDGFFANYESAPWGDPFNDIYHPRAG